MKNKIMIYKNFYFSIIHLVHIGLYKHEIKCSASSFKEIFPSPVMIEEL